MQPYSPLISTIRFQLMGLFTSMSLEWWKPARTSMILPNRPSWIQEISLWAAGKKGNSELQRTNTPGFSASAARMAAFARLVDAEGLLSHQVLARPDDVGVDPLVEVVRNRAVDRLDLGEESRSW